MDKTGEDWDGLHLGKFEKSRPTFFQIYVSLYQTRGLEALTRMLFSGHRWFVGEEWGPVTK